jgi:uncharacterized protein (DUF58 family)
MGMKRVVPLGILIYLLVLVGLGTLQGVLLALAVPLVVYLAAGLWFAPWNATLEVERTIQGERLVPGAPVQVALRVTNQGRTAAEVFIQDDLPPRLQVIEGENNLLTSLEPGESAELEYTLQGQRGVYRLDRVGITVSDHLGIADQNRDTSLPTGLSIVPDTQPLRKVAIRPRQTKVYSGIIPANQGGSGVDFFNVRDYTPGDSLRRINWRASARQNENFLTNEFQQERIADVGIILDARLANEMVTSQGSLFEHSVTAAAAVAEALLNDGNRVGLLVYGYYLDWTYPGYGKLQRERILQALARAVPGESQAFENLKNLPANIFPSHSQIILISPLLEDDYSVLLHLRVRGYQIMVISPDPVAFEAQSLPNDEGWQLAARLARIERTLQFNNLRQTGCQIFEWDVSIPFEKAMSYPLSRPAHTFHIRGV